MNNYTVTRLEKSVVVKKIIYSIKAKSKMECLKNLDLMNYEDRETRDEIFEDDWEPLDIIHFVKEKN